MKKVSTSERPDFAERFEWLLRATPDPIPRNVHREHVVIAMAQAYYRMFNLNDAFCRELEELFLTFSETSAERFAAEKRLPRGAATDLRWSRSLWTRTLLPRLYCGGRGYPAPPPVDDDAEARRLGYYDYPPRLRASGALHNGALRLYRRSTGWSWERIAWVESLARSEGIDVKSVRDSVRRWATTLGVSLPSRPAGRPPKS